jgi:hypothetical protein
VGLWLWLVAVVVAAVDITQSILAGQVLRTIVGVVCAFALLPAWHWLHERRRRVHLGFAAGSGWSLDRLGPIGTPRVLIDAGSWMLLIFTPTEGRAGRTPLVLPLMHADTSDLAWARLRQALRAARADGDPA